MIDIETVVLKRGSHGSLNEGVCLLEVVSMFAGEPFSDRPECVCPTLATFGRYWNDGMRTVEERSQLKRYISVLVGTAGTADDAERRAWLALDWSVRVSTPAWLDLAGLSDYAERLRGRPELVGNDDVTLEILRDTSRDAARTSSWAAAWAPSLAAARDAARAAARAAARDAARAAAWDAVRASSWAAAWAAAGAAAGAVLEPTVTALQESAHELFVRMIAAGPCNADALAALQVERGER